jgi:dTDP-4-amino-4,6-dideoxygalactose transaminase
MKNTKQTEPQKYIIPFNKVSLIGKEMEYVEKAILNGHISGSGPFTKSCQQLLENLLNIDKALLTTNCTHALEMSALLLDIQEGDEIIFPSFTFVSTTNAFVLRGAKPVFADIRADTLNLDERLLEGLITERTRAIVPVHYAGVGCEMDAIQEVAEKYRLSVVEDNAHGLFGKYKGQYLGTFGSMATLSFHETKNYSCGEGGALLISDKNYIERAEILCEKGTNRSQFFRGMVDKYTWVDIGSSYIPSEILAAFLFAQLEKLELIHSMRKQVWDIYYSSLKDWARTHHARVPFVPEYCDQAYHMFYMIMPSMNHRQRLIEHLKNRGIYSVFHYVPLNTSPVGQKFGGFPGQCPVTEDISDRLIRLPFYTCLAKDDQCQVIEAIRDFSV